MLGNATTSLHRTTTRCPLRAPRCRNFVAAAARRHYSTTRDDSRKEKIKSVAVLGGGITGLSAAWYLSKLAPTVPITLYEKSGRLGGWLNSKRVEYNGGSVLFEQGPRTLRPWSVAGLVTLDMIRQLKLEDEMAIISKTSPAARSRFIYYPDRLNQLPNSVASAMLAPRLPVMKGVVSGILKEPFRKRRSPDLRDESVGAFMSRRFGPNLARNLLSAVLHGIYAGDVDRLSVKSLFPKLWRDETVHGSLIRGMLATKNKAEIADDAALRAELTPDNAELMEKIKNASVYSFKDGIETLSRALVAELSRNPNVSIATSADVGGIEYSPDDTGLPFSLAGGRHSHVVSTLYAPATNSLLSPAHRIPALARIEAVTVLVANLYFATSNLLPVQGFGYLLPKSIPASSNPHDALGVIFDSCATPQPSETGTKVTVMLGGHHWNGRTSFPSDAEGVRMARDVLRRHLNIDEEPLAANAALNRDCIPQYNVGHDERLQTAKKALLDTFDGRLSVAGASYKGVGMNDCIRSARDVAKGLVEHGGRHTGLEHMGEELRWVGSEK